MKKFLFLIIASLVLLVTADCQIAKLGNLLSKRYPALGGNEQLIVLVHFADKGNLARSTTLNPRSFVSEKSLKRRSTVRSQSNLIDEQDIPLDRSYVRAIASRVVSVRHELKWFNDLSVVATKSQIDAIRRLPFVREIELVGRWKKKPGDEIMEADKNSPLLLAPMGTTSLDYGGSFTQVNQINVPAVHNLGIYGQGVMVGVFDNGFRLLSHEAFVSMHIIAQHDFVDHKTSVIPNNTSTAFGSHGVNTLSTIGGYKPGQLIGPAFGADFILARTENDSSETPIEEDNWAAAIQWADSIGVDVTSTSLGYLAYDAPYTSWTWLEMDGNTTLITRAADHAVELGIVVVNSAGNDGQVRAGQPNTLIAPADGDSVITAGAVTSAGARASFSSYGPTSDGRTKPDIMAMGVSVRVASSINPTGYGFSSGTSFSCPLSAGVATLVRCANPSLTPMQVREAMRQTASQAATPNNLMGWGILNADSAIKYFGAVHRGKIRGMVFADSNRNGAKDPGEPGVPNVMIQLAGTASESTMTDGSGAYVFDSLAIGSFTVSAVTPAGMVQTFPGKPAKPTIQLLFSAETTGVNFGLTEASPFSFIVMGSWNLLSLAYDPPDRSAGVLYPAAASPPFIYTGSYVPVTSIPNDSAYWIRFDSSQWVTTYGSLRTHSVLNLAEGWNMIGSLSVPMPVSSVRDSASIVSSLFFGWPWTSYMHADTLFPNQGYWVKASAAGSITLDTAQPAFAKNSGIKRMAGLSSFNSLTCKDAAGRTQTLYFGLTDARIDERLFELPPLPPSGSFDVRYASGKFIWLSDERMMPVEIQSAALPLTVSWNVVSDDIGYELLNVNRRQPVTLAKLTKGSGQIQLSAATGLGIGIGGHHPSGLPTAFTLGQNYPNPFNPTTVIHYSLPVESHVTLKIISLLGEEVEILVDENGDAGYKSVNFDASRLASGVYFYKLTAGNFSEVKKMMVMK